MGYVPAGPVPEEGQRYDLPGRQHRRARLALAALDRYELARWGERLAAAFLVRRGATLVAANPRHGKGEIDLVVQLGGRTVAVEVKTRRAGDPLESFTANKIQALRRTAGGLVPRPSRIDLVAISVGPDGVGVRWVPGAA